MLLRICMLLLRVRFCSSCWKSSWLTSSKSYINLFLRNLLANSLTTSEYWLETRIQWAMLQIQIDFSTLCKYSSYQEMVSLLSWGGLIRKFIAYKVFSKFISKFSFYIIMISNYKINHLSPIQHFIITIIINHHTRIIIMILILIIILIVITLLQIMVHHWLVYHDLWIVYLYICFIVFQEQIYLQTMDVIG